MDANQGTAIVSSKGATFARFLIPKDRGPLLPTQLAALPSNDAPLQGKYVKLEGLRREHIPDLFNNLGLPKDKSVFDWLHAVRDKGQSANYKSPH